MPKAGRDELQQSAKPAERESAPGKKKKSNPGIRLVGNRIYDSENGTSCHQCRQKTLETKAKCMACTLFFCPRCLENRYKEIVDEVNATGTWSCPKCRSLCNCSNCRKRQGLEATGILASVAKTAGFESVQHLLAKNPAAQSLAMLRASVATKDGALKKKKTAPTEKKAPQKPGLIDDASLPPRFTPFPSTRSLALHLRTAGVKPPPAARGCAWLSRLPDCVPCPSSVDQGQLVCIMEFLQVFGPSLTLRQVHAPLAIAVELLTDAVRAKTCPESDARLPQLQAKLLDVVRHAWGVSQRDLARDKWEALMLRYYQAMVELDGAGRAGRRRVGDEPPPAVLNDAEGEALVRGRAADPSGCGVRREDEAEGFEAESAGEGDGATRAQVQYPEGGYWALCPGMRVRMLYELVHDALDTFVLRDVVEESLKEAEELRRDSRQEELLAKKLARKEAEEQSQRELTLRLASLDARSLSLNQQKELLQSAREAVKVRTSHQDSSGPLSAPPALRISALGEEREGRRVYSLGSAGIWAEAGPLESRKGSAAELLLLVQSPCPVGGEAENPSKYGALRLDCPALAQCLDVSGKQESRLLHAVHQLQKKVGIKVANHASGEASEPLPSVHPEPARASPAGTSKLPYEAPPASDAARDAKSATAKGPAGGKKGASKKRPAASNAPAHKRTRRAIRVEASDCLPRKVDDMMAP